jgi:hypothetical protein
MSPSEPARIADTVVATGTLVCSRIARMRGRGRVTMGALIADLVDPLPPHEIWYVTVPNPGGKRDPLIYRTKSGRRPKCLTPEMENAEITFKARATAWPNGVGAYIANVRLIDGTACGVGE